MTIEEKKEALREAGVKVRSNASDETVNELYAETFGGESPEEAATEPIEPVISDDPPEEAVTVEDETPKTPKTPKPKGGGTMADFQKVVEAYATKQQGTKTPAVFEWADANLPAEDFNSIYAGKTVNGQKVQAK